MNLLTSLHFQQQPLHQRQDAVPFFRLRHIFRKLPTDDISKEHLLQNLEYAIKVLETVYIDETKSVDAIFLFRSVREKNHVSYAQL